MKYEQLAKHIIKNVGGKENINSLTHCITRFRFKLKDEKKPNTEVLKNMEGVEILIHVGMDTVQLEGKYFTPKVDQGAKIKKGDIILEFDKDAIEKEGYLITTPVIVTNSADYLDVIETNKDNIDYTEELLTVII
ncbi:PTS glucose transporter subunit IIA [Clostridium botulinum]|nr:PTS glucose transporter subunit IIA [Clostridium botulinum]